VNQAPTTGEPGWSSEQSPSEQAAAVAVPAAGARHVWARLTVFNPRLFLVRVLVSGVAVVATVAVVPGLAFSGWRGGEFLVVALTFAVLTAVVKPVLEFLALRFLVATYGFVIVVINAALLFVLAQVLDAFIVYDRLWQLLLGGVVVGLVGMVLETAAGATHPVLDTRERAESQ
jgi:putative membrane protein